MTLILYFLLSLAIFIFIHNLGMYIPAKIFGVRVEEFYVWIDMLGFRFFKFNFKETEFGLGWFPSGGYLKMTGMLLEDDEEIEPHHFQYLSLAKQLIILLGGSIFSLISGLLVYSYFLEIPLLNLIVVILGIVGIVLVFLFLFNQVAERNQSIKELNKPTKTLIYFLSVLFFYSIIWGISYCINEIIPLYECFQIILSGNLESHYFPEGYNNAQSLKLFISSLGIGFFYLNLLPIGTLNGFSIVNTIYKAFSKEEVPQKFVEKYSLYSLFLMLFIYVWIAEHFIRRLF